MNLSEDFVPFSLKALGYDMQWALPSVSSSHTFASPCPVIDDGPWGAGRGSRQQLKVWPGRCLSPSLPEAGVSLELILRVFRE